MNVYCDDVRDRVMGSIPIPMKMWKMIICSVLVLVAANTRIVGEERLSWHDVWDNGDECIGRSSGTTYLWVQYSLERRYYGVGTEAYESGVSSNNSDDDNMTFPFPPEPMVAFIQTNVGKITPQETLTTRFILLQISSQIHLIDYGKDNIDIHCPLYSLV